MALLYPFPKGLGHPPFHQHTHEDEEFFIVDGNVNFLINNEAKQTFGPGTYLWQPRGTKHTFWVDESQGRPSRMLAFVTPSGLDRVFREAGIRAHNVTLGENPTPVMFTPEQVEAFLGRAAEHGIIAYPPEATQQPPAQHSEL